MNWSGMPELSQQLMDAYVTDRLREMCDDGWQGAAAAIAVDLVEGRVQTAAVFDVDAAGVPDPESMRYLLVVPVADKWYPWLTVHYTRLEIPPEVVQMELLAAMSKHGFDVCPDDPSELEGDAP